MRRAFVLLVALAGCQQLFGLDSPKHLDAAAGDDDAPIADALADAIPDASACTGPSAQCLGDVLRTCADASSSPVDTTCAWGCGGSLAAHCLELQPAGGGVAATDLDPTGLGDVVLSNGMEILIDGDSGQIGTTLAPSQIRGAGTSVVNGIDYKVVNGVAVFRFKSLDMPTNVAPIGSHAIALVADGAITLAGVLDLRAPCGNQGSVGGYAGGGVGGNGAGPGGGGGANTPNGGSGGGYGGLGGKGGNAMLGSNGAKFGTAQITTLVGGGGGGGSSRAGGAGGGAIQLASNTRIDVSGGINAGGCGGQSSSSNAEGGAGGGAGGTILLEAPTLSVSGALAVNGGGGGSIGGGGAGSAGTLDRTPAAGGTGGARDGAVGAAGATADGGPGMVVTSRGSGGGGGIGRIRIDTRSGTATLGGSTMSPAPGDPASTCTVATAVVQ